MVIQSTETRSPTNHHQICVICNIWKPIGPTVPQRQDRHHVSVVPNALSMLQQNISWWTRH